jgi:hypothetical protein
MNLPCRLQSDLAASPLRFPDLLLEGRAMDVQEQTKRGSRCLEKLDDTVEHFVELLAFLLQGRLGKDPTELPLLAAQQNRTDALQGLATSTKPNVQVRL